MRRSAALAAVAALVTTAGVALTVPTVLAATPGDTASAGSTTSALAAPNINPADIRVHLQQFQSIATSSGGNRYSGRPGYTASLQYVEGKLRAAGYTVTRQTCTSGCTSGSVNLLAEWKGGDANQVIMLGAHLDGVAAGPGINDNGSGSALILQVALELARANPTMTKKVRFAWWSDEEQGLRGSAFYVNQLPAAERSKIKKYYNFDMVASRNAGYFINNITSSQAQYLKQYYDSIGVSTEENVEGRNRSDDASFTRAGIPATGVAAGASARKTSAQAQKWGGTAGAAYDSCYHAACDTISNVADTPLDRAADAVAHALWKDAVGTQVPSGFSMAVNPTSGSVPQGQAGSVTATVSTTTTSGSAQRVSLSASGLPAGVTATFSPSAVTSGGSATVTFSAASSAAGGTYAITVRGDGAEMFRTVTYTLTVSSHSPPPTTAPPTTAPPTTAPPTTPPAGGCNGIAAWDAARAYNPGDVVAHNGRRWNSTWYSTGAEPGAPGSWAVWADAGAC